ncbi:hypothetical protein ACQP2F_19530 [Actinoplanes sp. CA-030573]|uniref:hypothetical protein n=1 Tax=Actinoplanes sp. CA-030573 TaxID=3239898 RepID=UPI003D8AEAF7
MAELSELSEYDLRLRIAALRRRVFSQVDPTSNPGLLSQLALAEAEVSARELAASTDADVSSLEQAPVGGRILDTADTVAPRARGRARGRTAPATGLEARAVVRMAQVPTSIYHLYKQDENPLVTCTVRNTGGAPRRLRITSFLEGYSARAVSTREVPSNQEVSVNQLPALFHDRLHDLDELTTAAVNVLIEDLDGPVELNDTYSVPLLARTSVPLAVKDPATGKWADVSKYLGAFVTPNAPKILAFLRTVADQLPETRLVGYEQGAKEARAEVEAIFKALKNLGIIYVNSVVAFSPYEGAAVQRVRLPRESLEDREANCIDGTVLVASLMEAATLNPAIVIVPGHAFVGWETDQGSGEWSYLETTMIGTSSFGDACDSAEVMAKQYEELATSSGDPSNFRRWPLSELRTTLGITPTE